MQPETTISIHPDTPVVVAARLAAHAGYRLEYCPSTGRVVMIDDGPAVRSFHRLVANVRAKFEAAESVTPEEVRNAHG